MLSTSSLLFKVLRSRASNLEYRATPKPRVLVLNVATRTCGNQTGRVPQFSKLTTCRAMVRE